MKRLISLVLAAAMLLAFAPAVFADEIEVDTLYDAYGLGEEIFICGTLPPGTVTVRIVIANSAGSPMTSQTADAMEFTDGIYIGVNRAWPLEEYTLYLITERGDTFTHVFEIVQDRVDHSTGSGSGSGSSGGSRNDVIATDVTITQTELLLHLGETATVSAAGESKSFKWTTDDNDKITIDGANSATATITPKRTGRAIVWVYCGNNYATLTIDIVPADKTNVPGTNKNDQSGKENESNGKQEQKEPVESVEQDKPTLQEDLFTDLDATPWARDGINALAKAGVLSGMGDGTFAPAENVTRAQFVQMIVNAFEFSSTGESSFTDVSDEWFAPAVLIAADNGIVNGYDGRFEPNANITCQDAVVIIRRVLDMKGISLPKPLNLTEDDESEAAWYAREPIALLRANGMIPDEMGFSPLENATRAQSAYLIYGAYGHNK
ncbi:MAG: S-layer homology domain-containing protein [Oscillospiraceae bacterium]|nr:S-layer homology domain-containing protein [Oscillospiraceae bacterium]